MRSILRAVLSAAALTLSACGPADDLDLDALPLADEAADEKADGAASYLWARPSLGIIRCLRHPCESHLNRAVNDGPSRPVYRYDLRSLRLSASRRAAVEARLGELLVRGRSYETRVSGELVAVFQVTRAMEPVSPEAQDSPAEDRYFQVMAGGSDCGKGACPALAARPISGGSAQPWDAVDLAALELPAATEAALRRELPQGYVYLSVRRVTGGTAQATQAFRSIFAPPLR